MLDVIKIVPGETDGGGLAVTSTLSRNSVKPSVRNATLYIAGSLPYCLKVTDTVTGIAGLLSKTLMYCGG
jgi:hypothetical protein